MPRVREGLGVGPPATKAERSRGRDTDADTRDLLTLYASDDLLMTVSFLLAGLMDSAGFFYSGLR